MTNYINEVDNSTKGVNLPKGLYARNGKAEQIMKLVAEGLGTREIQRLANATGRTVRRYRDTLQKVIGVEFKCKCGKPAAHQDHCEKI